MKVLLETEAEDFLEKNNFPIVKRTLIKKEKDLDNLKLKFPLTLKVTNELHKSDIKGVILNVDEENLLESYKKLKKKSKTVLAQEHIKGHSLILGIKNDPTFGSTILIGSGGIYTEILKDISINLPPLTKKEALSMIESLKIYPILKGARGEKEVNINSIVNVLLKLSELAEKHPEIQELDINPLIVNEKNSLIVDARVIF